MRAEGEEICKERKRAQEGARAALEGGERRWRDALGGVVGVGVEMG